MSDQPANSLQFIGTATVLIRFGELTVLTDPNFLHRGERAYLGYGYTAKRLTEPALSVAQLPPLSAVVLSHLHGDHWDRRARNGLAKSVPIITTRHASRRLHRSGFAEATGLSTWQQHRLRSESTTLSVTSLPGRHAPSPLQHLLPPVMGSYLDFRQLQDDGSSRQLGLYITGDTLFIEELRQIPERTPPIDLAVAHLGGTRLPGGLMVTMDGRQGADLIQQLDLSDLVPVHYDDYRVFKSPLADFMTETERRGLTERVHVVHRGETLDLAPFVRLVRPSDPLTPRP